MPDARVNTAADVLNATLSEIASQNERGAAVVGAALVEKHLTLAIASRFVDLNETDKGELFDGCGPLATFAAKIRVGFAMGVFGPTIRNDLKIVDDIRRDFGRADELLAFDCDEIALQCAQLSSSLRFTGAPRADADPRTRYLATVEFLVSALVGACLAKRDMRPKPLGLLQF
ncbi:MAG TPA: hypothetical protein VEU53_03180 [Stellaceae bacterium]|nr:hypothetical protein [Stellaceae bacterium]